MKLKIIIGIIIVMVCILNVAAQPQERVVKLKDGTVVQGEVLSKEGDVYKIATKTLGVISVKDIDIASIGEGQSVYQEPQGIPNVEEIKQGIVGNAQVIALAESLALDPKVVEMFEDPALKAAIARQDMDYLQNNEKFMELVRSPEMEKIFKDLTDEATVSK